MKDYKKLHVWHESHALVLQLYRILMKFPSEEKYGITSQLKRAAVSIPTNIAEGCGRFSEAELRRFLIISSGSAAEVEYLLLLSFELEYLSKNDFNVLNESILLIKKMLTSFKNIDFLTKADTELS